MRFSSLLLLSALALTSVGLSGCLSDQAYRRGSVLADADFDMLWDRGRMVLQSQGYQIDEQGTSRSKMRMATHWQTQLAPARYKGKRRRADVRFVALGGGRYQTEVLVTQERNTEISDPMSILAADWEDERDEFVSQREEVILYRIESFFVRPELGD